jgi:hypothetical protein
MAKALKDILEVYAPASKDEKRFKDKHIVARSKLDKPSEDDAMFNATNVKVVDREKTKHGYNPNKDESVYESVHAMALHVKPVKVNGKTKYKVHAVGTDLSDGIKVGEHLSDTQLDDATEMGAKIKHIKENNLHEKTLTPAEKKKREEIALAIARENPKMPMSKKMAIATASAKKVAEEVEDLDESNSSHDMFQKNHNEAAAYIKGITKALSAHYDSVTNKKNYGKGEAQWHHVEQIKEINRSLSDLHDRILMRSDNNQPMKIMGESVEMDDDMVALINIVYESLSDENKEVLEQIIENDPDQLMEFLDQLEVQNG